MYNLPWTCAEAPLGVAPFVAELLLLTYPKLCGTPRTFEDFSLPPLPLLPCGLLRRSRLPLVGLGGAGAGGGGGGLPTPGESV